MGNINAESAMYAHYVRYERLFPITNTELGQSSAEEINLVIDATSIIKSVYQFQPEDFINPYSITACIINAAAHYRNFYWSRYQVKSNIYIIFSDMRQSINEAKAFVQEYGNFFTMKPNPSMDKFILNNLNLLKKLCPYLGDIKFINSWYEPWLVTSRICKYFNNINKPTIIVSKDILFYQLFAYFDNIHILRPRKSKGEDTSYYVNKDIAMEAYCLDQGCNKVIWNNSPQLIPLVMAGTKLTERGLKSICTIPSFLKMVNDAIINGDLSNSIIGFDPKVSLPILRDKYRPKLKTYETELRFNAFCAPALYRYITNPVLEDLNMINLYDPDSIKRINETYFNNLPLDLMSL